MNTKKVCAVILAALLTVSVTACGKDKKKDKSKSKAESSATSSSKEESSKKDESSTSSDTKKEQESVKVYYGWGSSEDEEKYTTEIFCPEGAEFDETTLEDYEEDGSVITAMIIDEVNEYKAVSATHWHRDAYNNDPLNYPIIAQLYFDGEVDAETAAENSGCSHWLLVSGSPIPTPTHNSSPCFIDIGNWYWQHWILATFSIVHKSTQISTNLICENW